jgi:hypothetical protein
MSTQDWANQITPEGEIPSESDCPGYRRSDGLLGLRRFSSSAFFCSHGDSFA